MSRLEHTSLSYTSISRSKCLLPFLGSPRPMALRDLLRFLLARFRLMLPGPEGAPGSENEEALVGRLAWIMKQ